ncbi:hypothetical protein I4U23_029378 [Adineta vaga]|nr:hypothetical protein I4U23_029378 [Adineta vaga]
MGGRLSGLGNALYDSKRREFLGRDGAQWGKLGVFYFFFYIGLAGFFCAMLAVFMALTPRDHPYYTSHDSRMKTRSNPLSPGLGFRPQPDVERNLIELKKNGYDNETKRYVESLNKYLQVYYWKQSPKGQHTRYSPQQQSPAESEFNIANPGECTNASLYGYSTGRPCVLVKMNKIIDYVPEPLGRDYDPKDFPARCSRQDNAITIGCQGEYPADVDNVGDIRYISETTQNDNCGSINLNRFPYTGKSDRKDVYQAPYLWIQFLNPKPNVLINVICRAYAQNIDFDKKTGRGLTRFQIFVHNK